MKCKRCGYGGPKRPGKGCPICTRNEKDAPRLVAEENKQLMDAISDIQALLWGSPSQDDLNKAFFTTREALARAEGRKP
jgi:hypothetical protein